jgi:hypothetical protein
MAQRPQFQIADIEEASVMDRLRVGEEALDVVDRRKRHFMAAGLLKELRGRQDRNARGEFATQVVEIRRARRRAGKAFIANEVGTREQLAHAMELVVLQHQAEDMAVACPEGAVNVAYHRRGRIRSAEGVVGHALGQDERCPGIKHARVDALSVPGRVVVVERRQDGERRRQGGDLVDHRIADRLWRAVTALHGHEADQTLDHLVVGRLASIGRVIAHPVDRGVDQARVDSLKRGMGQGHIGPATTVAKSRTFSPVQGPVTPGHAPWRSLSSSP